VHTHRVDKSGLRPPKLKQFSDSQKLLITSDNVNGMKVFGKQEDRSGNEVDR
jgi:hypothetical protein